jgi:hypothetical protein
VGKLAAQPYHRPARHRFALAPSRLLGNLGVRLMRPLARRTPKDQWRGPRAYTLPLSPYQIPVDNRTAIPYTLWMLIRSVQHKGLVRFIEDDDSRELRPDLVKRLRNILAVLITAADITKLLGRRAGASTSLKVTAPGHGAFR